MENDKYLQWICKNLAKVWDEKRGLTSQNITGTLVLFQHVFPSTEGKEIIWNMYEYFEKAIKIIKTERKYNEY